MAGKPSFAVLKAAQKFAARLSDMAQGGEVLLSKRVLDDPGARTFAEEMNCDQEQLATLRGVMQAVEICRMRPGI